MSTWRYDNYGIADTLTISGTTLTDLPESKSRTGSAFYQTTRAKCFDLPTTDEVWMKFDLYHYSGTSRFRVYDDKNGSTANGFVLTQNSSTQVALWSWNGSANVERKTFDGALKANTLQTWLFHMRAGTNDGLLELWCDGVFIGSWTGNVNNGADFADIYFQTDDANNIFSNVIISNEQIGLNENAKINNVTLNLTLDVKRRVETPEHIANLFSYLKAWLPFDKSPTFDVMLNEWTTYGTPTVSNGALQLDGQSYIKLSGIELGGQDFQIDGWVYVDSSSPNNARVLHIVNSSGFALVSIRKNTNDATKLDFWANAYADVSQDYGYTYVSSINSVGQRVHFKLIYRYSAKRLSLCINDIIAAEWTSVVQYNRQSFDIYIGALANGNQGLIGSVDELRIFDGTWFSYNYGVVPTAEEYEYFKSRIPKFTATVDVERRVKNIVEVAADVQRQVIFPIVIPFIGEHFNHYVPSIIVAAGGYQKFILPKSSKVYVRGDEYYGAVQIFSDTDSTGKITSNYAELDECNTVFIGTSPTNTPQQVIRKFMYWLKYLSGTQLDEAINRCTCGNIADTATLTANFMRDLNASASYTDFLLDYCDIDLTNADTGAITGWDAGGGEVKTAASVVPEQIPIEDWTVPAAGSTSTIFGLTVQFPYFGVNGSFTDAEKFILAGLNSEWIESESEDEDGSEGSVVIVIPSQGVLAEDSKTTGIQSIEITLAEQQLTDQVKVVGINPLEIMTPIKGQYLDYVFDMRVEKFTRQGILYSAECCSNIDELLYMAIDYPLQETNVTATYTSKTGKPRIETFTLGRPAKAYIDLIAGALDFDKVKSFSDFYSTVQFESRAESGVTYAELIRDVFGWSARVPTQLINVYIRGGTLYAIQRGKESNTIDISDADKTQPIITHELVRTYYQRSKFSTTVVTEAQEPQPHQNTTPDDPDDDDEESPWSNVGEVITEDSHGRTVTSYTYTKDGVLKKTVAEFTSFEDINENSVTTTTNSYKSDGTLDKTTSEVKFTNRNESTKTITTYGYMTLSDGKKFLSTEMVEEYENGVWVDTRVTTKSPTGRGQGATTDNRNNSSASGNISDDRPTPYSKYTASTPGNSSEDDASDDEEEETTQFYTEIEGVTLFDTSFPIQNVSQADLDAFELAMEAALKAGEIDGYVIPKTTVYDSLGSGRLEDLTYSIIKLNRATKETVTLSIYNFPHLIDFNDKIILDGATYYLVSNTARTTPRIFNEQNLTLVRWILLSKYDSTDTAGEESGD